LPSVDLFALLFYTCSVLAKVHAAAVIGLQGEIVEVEVDHQRGLPHFIIVGLPDAAVQESRERVRSAIRNAGLRFPRHRVTVNLAPADLRKEGPAYDLPIALGALAAGGEINRDWLDDALAVGELSLDGSLRHIRGVLPMAALAQRQGFKRMFVPAIDSAEAALVPGIDVIAVETLTGLVNHLSGVVPIEPTPTGELSGPNGSVGVDFSEIKGQEHVKRALEIAAAGGHNALMTGPPGAGKTLMARALPSILPCMTFNEAIEVTGIYSVADQLPAEVPMIQARPFRAPHHTISHAGLVGGGNWPRPGEISLAHRGVLFLDELPEFGMRVLEVLRQPMEDKVVTISRARGSHSFPANFMLVAAMNPCPCGYFGDSGRQCTCSPGAVTRYQKRISGPLLDRIDIHIDVPRLEYEKLSDDRLGEPSGQIRSRIETARARQRSRLEGDGMACNADMGPGAVREHCRLSEDGSSLLRQAMNQLQLSARAYHRTLKLARTIADLAGSQNITPSHLAEALGYRPRV
jgi:magnesium chelatase family protein